MPGVPVGGRARVGRDDGIVRELLAQLPHQPLRVDDPGRSLSVMAWRSMVSHQRATFFSILSRQRPVGFAVEQWQQRPQGGTRRRRPG